MGARLVSLALTADWAVALSPRARIVLITMCQRSMDARRGDYPPRTYWAGHEDLAIAAYGKTTDSALRQVRKLITELEKAGAIETLMTAAGRSSKATYLVTPENWPGHWHCQDRLPQAETATQAGTSPAPNGRHPST